MKGIAVLNFNQFQEFQSTGLIPEYRIDGEQIPAYAFSGAGRKFGAGKKWKLFPKDIGKEDLLYLYRRIDIAANAIDIPAKDVWSKGFTIKVTDDDGKEVMDSPLEKAIWQLNKDCKVKAIFEEAYRYARLFGLGIVVIGLADNKKLIEPVERAQSVTYLRAFSSMEVTDFTYDRDPTSERFGEIATYKVAIMGDETTKFETHASRVIHVMEKTVHKSPLGVSVLEAPYDLFQILKNTDWSAGEAYYQNASPIFVIQWEGEEAPTKTEKDAMKADLEDLHVKKRMIMPKAFEFKAIQGSGSLPNPENVWNTIIERIAGGVKIPKQILLGTSAGALASGEVNLQQYFKDIAGTQSNFAEPLLLDFYGRLQEWGILPEGEFDIEWTPLWEMSEKERAAIGYQKMQTASLAVGSKRNTPLMSIEEAREQILGLTPEMGGGRLSTLKTEAAASSPILPVSTDMLVRELEALKNEALRGVPLEKVLEKAKTLIKYHVGLARENSRQYVERQLSRSIPMLPPEMEAEFNQMEAQYVADFEGILKDAVEGG